MRRLLGLLMIVAIIFLLFLGVGGVIVVNDVIGQVQMTVNRRTEAISARLSQTEETINAVSARFDALKGVADQVSAAARTASQAVTATMSDTTAHYDGVVWPEGTNSVDIPAANLAVPGLSSARGYLQNLYDAVASLSSAISDVTAINQVPGVFGQAVSEAQGLSAELNALSTIYSPTLLLLLIGFLVWLAIIYVLLVLSWLKLGWGMLLGRPAAGRPT